MTTHTTVVLHRINTTVFSQLKQEWSLKRPEVVLYWALLSSFDFTVVFFHLQYYGKQPSVK